MADDRLRCERSVLFNIDQFAAPKRNDIDIMITGKTIGKTNTLIIARIIVHMIVADKDAFCRAKFQHSLKHLIIHSR